METRECAAAVTFQGRAEERDDDLEHLPPLLEDEVGKRMIKMIHNIWDFKADLGRVFRLKREKVPSSLLICCTRKL